MSIQLKLLSGTALLGVIAVGTFLSVQSGQDDARRLSAELFTHGVAPVSALERADARASLLAAEEGGPSPAASAALGDILAALGQAAPNVAPGTAAAVQIEELRYIVSRLRAADGEVSERFMRRELAEIAGRTGEALALVGAETQARANAVGDRMEVAARTGTAGLLALLLGLCGLAFALSADLQRRLRDAVEALRTLEPQAAAAHPSPPSATFEGLDGVIAELAGNFHARRRETAEAQASASTRLEEEIARLEKHFEATIEKMQEGYCLIDDKRRLVAANEPFRRLFEGAAAGTRADDLVADPALRSALSTRGPATVVTETQNGRVLELRRHAVSGRSTIVLVNDITERHVANRTIERLAGCDPLTGLPNRARFLEHLGMILSERNATQDAAVLCFDIQGFGVINAAHGDAAGDFVLRTCAERLAGTLQGEDFLARIGPDEFAIVQTGHVQPDQCEATARAVLDAFTAPITDENFSVSARLSVGMVHVEARGDRPLLDRHAVLHDAEAALREARVDKGSDKGGGYRLFSEAIRQEADERRRLEADLREALSRDQFELHFQPFADVSRRVVSGFEALLRWNHPTRGWIGPAVFIPIAEEIGLMDEIGAFVLNEACRTAAGWPEHLSVAVNLSALQFHNPRLVAEVRASIAAAGLPAHRLELEVTESVFLDDVGGTLEKLKALRALGLRILMDDFGTGYSSLGYLSRFPFDKLKIDQSFVRDMNRRENLAIIRAMIGLSQSMGIGVIAEGVETREQFDALRREGCTQMQGYLIGRPGPASDLPRHLVRVERAFATGEFSGAFPPAQERSGAA